MFLFSGGHSNAGLDRTSLGQKRNIVSVEGFLTIGFCGYTQILKGKYFVFGYTSATTPVFFNKREHWPSRKVIIDHQGLLKSDRVPPRFRVKRKKKVHHFLPSWTLATMSSFQLWGRACMQNASRNKKN